MKPEVATNGADPSAEIARDALHLGYELVLPTSAFERAICEAFSRVFRVQPIGIDDDFYDLGGDSLIREQLAIEIERAAAKPFSISQIFEFGTPRSIARLLSAECPVGAEKPGEGVLFVVHGRGGYTALRPEFRNALTSPTYIHTFELPGIRGGGPMLTKLSDVAAAYVRQIQEIQPHGEIRLAAFCLGSLIALEMAGQLRALGRPLHRLVLLDPRLPSGVSRRFAAEKRLAASPSLGAVLRYFTATGRLPGSAFLGPVLEPLVFRRVMRKELRGIKRDHRNGRSFAKRYDGLGMKDEPRAALLASYHFSWPEPFEGRTYILASRDRVGTFSDGAKAWTWLTPRKTIDVVADAHHQIGSAAAPVVATRIDQILFGPSDNSVALAG